MTNRTKAALLLAQDAAKVIGVCALIALALFAERDLFVVLLDGCIWFLDTVIMGMLDAFADLLDEHAAIIMVVAAAFQALILFLTFRSYYRKKLAYLNATEPENR